MQENEVHRLREMQTASVASQNLRFCISKTREAHLEGAAVNIDDPLKAVQRVRLAWKRVTKRHVANNVANVDPAGVWCLLQVSVARAARSASSCSQHEEDSKLRGHTAISIEHDRVLVLRRTSLAMGNRDSEPSTCRAR